MKKIAIFG